jgi:hypothetical protein
MDAMEIENTLYPQLNQPVYRILLLMEPSRAEPLENLGVFRLSATWIHGDLENLLTKEEFQGLLEEPAANGFCYCDSNGETFVHEMVSTIIGL